MQILYFEYCKSAKVTIIYIFSGSENAEILSFLKSNDGLH